MFTQTCEEVLLGMFINVLNTVTHVNNNIYVYKNM